MSLYENRRIWGDKVINAVDTMSSFSFLFLHMFSTIVRTVVALLCVGNIAGVGFNLYANFSVWDVTRSRSVLVPTSAKIQCRN